VSGPLFPRLFRTFRDQRFDLRHLRRLWFQKKNQN
jgi:hypothetical protein